MAEEEEVGRLLWLLCGREPGILGVETGVWYTTRCCHKRVEGRREVGPHRVKLDWATDGSKWLLPEESSSAASRQGKNVSGIP